MLLRSKYCYLIDYIIMLPGDLQDILNTRAIREANYSTEYIMIKFTTKEEEARN